MGLGDLWRTRTGTGSEVHYECRQCGTTVERPAAECPVCASASIAAYELT